MVQALGWLDSPDRPDTYASVYAPGRVIHDADAHIMEEADWLLPHAEASLRERPSRCSWPR